MLMEMLVIVLVLLLIRLLQVGAIVKVGDFLSIASAELSSEPPPPPYTPPTVSFFFCLLLFIRCRLCCQVFVFGLVFDYMLIE